MQKKNKKDQFVSLSEETVSKSGIPENIPPSGEMKGNPVFYGKEVGVKPTKKLIKKLTEDAREDSNE